MLSQNQHYIVLELLGLSIKDILKKNKRHFSIKCVMTMGLQLLDLLEKFHGEGFIHCDLKPDNILLDFQSKSLDSVNLVDFGFSTKYLDKDGKHLPQRDLESFRGNMLFASSNQFEFKSTSRRDDLISLLYLMVYLLNKDLPWLTEQNMGKSECYFHVKKLKANVKDVCSGNAAFLNHF